jgi:hypothetical protein
MTVEIYVTESPGTLAVDCRDIITVDDLCYVLERCLSAVSARPQHFLIDCSNLATLAPGALHTLASYADFLQHPNTQWLAFVTDNSFLKNAIQLLFDSEALRVFEDRETAARFLRGLIE